ncbi:MAG: RAMP superfamily CRISPR-associated protein [Candidatus Binataceae bacterium]
MNFDVYAELAVFRGGPIDGPLPAGLASGFVDRCTTVFHVAEVKRERGATQQQRREAEEEEKNDARGRYIQRVPQRQLTLPHDLGLDADAGEPPDPSWVRFDIKFKVETPWYSKDDRLFHVLDNPVRKDRVFGVPFMSAASWKGLLRWACRMQASLGERPREPGQKRDGRREPAWITHLFGNEKGEEEHFQQGALAFYATGSRGSGLRLSTHTAVRRALEPIPSITRWFRPAPMVLSDCSMVRCQVRRIGTKLRWGRPSRGCWLPLKRCSPPMGFRPRGQWGGARQRLKVGRLCGERWSPSLRRRLRI